MEVSKDFIVLDELPDAILKKRWQDMDRKEMNATIFQMNNNLTWCEVEFVQTWMRLFKKQPERLKFPNGEIKDLSWKEMS